MAAHAFGGLAEWNGRMGHFSICSRQVVFMNSRPDRFMRKLTPLKTHGRSIYCSPRALLWAVDGGQTLVRRAFRLHSAGQQLGVVRASPMTRRAGLGHFQNSIGIMACGDQRPCSIEERHPRYAPDAIIAIKMGLIASGAARNRGDDERKRLTRNQVICSRG